MTDWLTGTFLATSLLMALVLLVREPVRRRFGPAVAYGLWLVPALRLVMPPLTQTVERAVPADQPSLALMGPAPDFTASVPAPSLVDQLGGWPALALSAWLAGAAIMLLGGYFTYRWQRREVLREAVQLAQLGDIRLIRSAAVTGPIAFGVFDRVIALPEDFDDRYDPRERRFAFAHELAHHRSGDLVVNHLAFVLLSLQWFNPLAWLSHSAFRFDQEAACDARVLDQVAASDRAIYAHAIAKAASGRALLFAGALDRPRTLHRRLRSMLTTATSSRRTAGKALIAVAAIAALPLTASWATEYVDVAQPANAAVPVTPAVAPAVASVVASARAAVPAPAAQVTPADAELPVPDLNGVKLGKDDVSFFDDDTILMDGKRRRLEQLDAAERAKLRSKLTKAQGDLARERAELPHQLADIKEQTDRIKSGEMRRELVNARQEMRRALAELDAQAPALRAVGQDVGKLKAEIAKDLREAEAMDIDGEVARTLEEANPQKIMAELQSAEQQMARIRTKLDQLDRR